MDQVVRDIRDELVSNADEKTRNGPRRFFKEEVRHYGVRSAVVEKIARKYFKEIRPPGKERVFALREELFRSGYNEEAGGLPLPALLPGCR